VHVSMDRRAAQSILKLFDEAHLEFRKRSICTSFLTASNGDKPNLGGVAMTFDGTLSEKERASELGRALRVTEDRRRGRAPEGDAPMSKV
jgi:hypothetical protein